VYPIRVWAELPRSDAFSSVTGSWEMPCRRKQRCRALRVRFGTASRRPPMMSDERQERAPADLDDDRFPGG
jgi:hypothetical protein